MSFTGMLRGLAIGAGAMYFLDPDRGRRRRALVRDQWRGLSHLTGDFFDKALRDAQNRFEGTLAEVAGMMHQEELSEEVLVDRVRSKLGRYVSHPRAIEVSVHDGRVVLSGAILESELPGLMRAVRSVRGVRGVDNRTTPHAEAGNVSDLQGGRARFGEQPDVMQANWAPSTRLFMGGLGSLLMLNCLVRRNLSSMLLGTLGFGLVSSSMSHCEQLQRMRPSESGPSTSPARRVPAETQ
jgi:hypothetical protein